MALPKTKQLPSSPLSPLRISPAANVFTASSSHSNGHSHSNSKGSNTNSEPNTNPSSTTNSNLNLHLLNDGGDSSTRTPRQQHLLRTHSRTSSHNKLPSLVIDTSNTSNRASTTKPASKRKHNSHHSHRSNKLIVPSHIEDFQPDLNLDEFLEEIEEKKNQDGPADDNNKDRMPTGSLRNAVNLTSVLLDTRKALRSDYHIVENDAKKIDRVGSPIQASSSMNSYNSYDSDNVYKSPLKISRATKARAEKVNLMFRFHYLVIERYYEKYASYADGSSLVSKAGSFFPVDSQYNPLQTIRNRALRSKYHEYPKPLSIKPIPLACNMFSSHNKNLMQSENDGHRHHLRRRSDKPWKMLWAVELTERYSDIGWQHLHWHELVDPKGELWFPETSSLLQLPNPADAPSSSSRDSHKGVRQRLHDRLFNSEEEDKYASRRNSLLGAGSIGDYHISNVSHSLRSRKKRKKKLSIPSDDSQNASSSNLPSLLKDKLFKKVPRVSDSSNESNIENPQYFSGDESDEISLLDNLIPGSEDQYASNEDREVDSRYVDLNDFDEDGFREIYDDIESGQSVEIDNVKDVPIKKVHSGNLAEENANSGNFEQNSDGEIIEIHRVEEGDEDTKSENGQITQEANKAADEEKILEAKCKEISLEQVATLNNIVYSYKYLDSLLNIRSHYVGNVLPQILSNHYQKVAQLVDIEIPKAIELSVKVNDHLLPAYEGIYEELLDEINSLIHHINEDYSMRVDNLLSSSDRLIGEINTSLSLELRKFNEKIDRLNSSFFGSRFNFEINDHKDKILRMNNNNNQMLYYFIENMIIILLRLIWIVVNCYKMVRVVVVFFYRLIRVFTG